MSTPEMAPPSAARAVGTRRRTASPIANRTPAHAKRPVTSAAGGIAATESRIATNVPPHRNVATTTAPTALRSAERLTRAYSRSGERAEAQHRGSVRWTALGNGYATLGSDRRPGSGCALFGSVAGPGGTICESGPVATLSPASQIAPHTGRRLVSGKRSNPRLGEGTPTTCPEVAGRREGYAEREQSRTGRSHGWRRPS